MNIYSFSWYTLEQDAVVTSINQPNEQFEIAVDTNQDTGSKPLSMECSFAYVILNKTRLVLAPLILH